MRLFLLFASGVMTYVTFRVVASGNGEAWLRSPVGQAFVVAALALGVVAVIWGTAPKRRRGRGRRRK